MKIPKVKPIIVTNFPKDHPKWKKIFANIMFNIGGFVVFKRNNLLSNKDIISIKETIQSGDILLLGNLRTIFSKFIREPITHMSLAINKTYMIQATINGVHTISLKKILLIYDTCIILRTDTDDKDIINKTINYAKKELNKPYNYMFKEEDKTLFCVSLINESLKKAGYNSNINTFKPHNKLELFLKQKIKYKRILSATKPSNYIKGNFKIKFISQNLIVTKNKKIKLKNKESIMKKINKKLNFTNL